MTRRTAIGAIPWKELWVVKTTEESHLPEYEQTRWLYRIVAKGQDQDNKRKRVFIMQKVDVDSRMPLGWCLSFTEEGTALVENEMYIAWADRDAKHGKWPPHWLKNKEESA